MRREKGGFWVGAAAAIFYPLARLVGRGRYVGGEYIPRTGAALLVANHISYLDPVFSALLVHKNGRVPRFLAKHSLWNAPVLGRIMRGTGQIPVLRDTADARRSLSEATAALRQGKVVVIYPEGTITRDPDGWPMQARTGAARLALTVDVPVVPVAHWGTREVYDHYAKRFRPLPRTTISVVAGPPIDLSRYRGRPIDAELLKEVTEVIMSRVRELVAEVRGEPAPTTFYRPEAAS